MKELRGFAETVQEWFTWMGQRWAISEPPPGWTVLLALLIIVALTVFRPAWIFARHAVTVVHEMGHVVVAWVCGRRIQGIRLHTDTSGLAITAGKPRGLGMLLTFLAGYTAPSVLGLAMVWSSFAGYSGIALTAVVAVLALAFLLVRNAFGFFVVITALSASGYILWVGEPKLVTAATFIAGMFLTIGAVRCVGDLWRVTGNGSAPDSDAAMASQHSLLPTVVWVGVFWVFSIVCALLAVSVIFYAVYG